MIVNGDTMEIGAGLILRGENGADESTAHRDDMYNRFSVFRGFLSMGFIHSFGVLHERSMALANLMGNNRYLDFEYNAT